MNFNKHQIIAFVAGTTVAIAAFIPQIAQAQTPRQMFPMLTGVELTQQQQTQLTAIRSQTRSQIEKILRPEQITAFKSAIAQGQTWQQAIAAVNLTNDQKTQLRQVFQSARKQASGILTPEQKQQLIQNLRTKASQRFGVR